MPGSARIVRDEGTGEVVRIVYDGDDGGDGGMKRKKKGGVERMWAGRRLVDVLGSEDEDEDGNKVVGDTQHDLIVGDSGDGGLLLDMDGGEERGKVVQQLAKQASMTGGVKRPRKQSQREEEWVERLVRRHGKDVEAMARDRKLNPMQQSKGDIGKRIRMWREWRRKGGKHGDGGMDVE